MTPEELKEQAQLMLDWCEKPFPVQYQPKGCPPDFGWIDCGETGPIWNFQKSIYRRKPREPRVRWALYLGGIFHNSHSSESAARLTVSQFTLKDVEIVKLVEEK